MNDAKKKRKGLLSNKLLWIVVGAVIFLFVGFILPTPRSMLDLVKEQGFGKTMIEWHVASDMDQAAWKMKLVLGMIPMAIIYFATEALPIGLVGILMPILAYFFHLLPTKMIGQTFAGDAPLFLLGVLAMGVTVISVGLHKRLATWILGWTKGFAMPIIVLCVAMSTLGSFISAHAMAAFMAPVMAAVYMGAVSAGSREGTIQHDPQLAKLLLFSLCFALNVGGVGSPAAGGRNVIMMGFWADYNIPMSFGRWMMYGLPLAPILGLAVATYMLLAFRGVKTKDLTPGLVAIKEETKRMGPMSYAEKVALGMMLLILVLWIFEVAAAQASGDPLGFAAVPASVVDQDDFVAQSDRAQVFEEQRHVPAGGVRASVARQYETHVDRHQSLRWQLARRKATAAE